MHLFARCRRDPSTIFGSLTVDYSCSHVEFPTFQDWSLAHSKGAFFFEEDDGSIVSHIYRIDVPKDSSVWITIEPYSLRSGGGIVLLLCYYGFKYLKILLQSCFLFSPNCFLWRLMKARYLSPSLFSDFNSARGLGSSAPVDTLLFLVKDDTLIAYTDQRDSSGVTLSL